MCAYLLIIAEVFAVNCFVGQQADIGFRHGQVEQVIGNLLFGQRQVEQFICDRPDAGEIIKREPVLRLLLIWYFAGELKGCRAYWDYREPTGGQPAEHLPSLSGYPALIRVSNKCGSSPIDKCTMLVFELMNLETDKEYQLLFNAPIEKRKSRDDFAASCVRLEFAALKKTQLYFIAHPLAEANYKKNPYYSSVISSQADFSVYSRWLDGLDSKAFDPRRYYRQAYDKLLPDPAR